MLLPIILVCSLLVLCVQVLPGTAIVPPTVTANEVSITETKGRETTVVSFNITGDSPQVKVEDIRWSFKHIGSVDKMPLNTTCTIVNCSDTRYMRYNFSDDLTTLTISNLQVEDYGVYTLTAGNAAGENSATVSLTVNVPPQLLDSNTEVINRNESESVLLECTADANPKPSFLWFHNGALFSGATSEEHKAFREDILTIPGNLSVTTRVSITDLRERDGGVYLCLAGNGIEPFSDREFRVNVIVVAIDHCQPNPCEHNGICINLISDFICYCQEENGVAYDGRTCDTQVLVEIPARITRQPEDTFVNLDSRVELYCEADGSPEPIIRWYYEDVQIDGVVGSPFAIQNVNRNNRGYYTCTATNVVNTVTSRRALVNIPDIAEYLARLIIPINQFQGNNFASEADQIVENINIRVAGSVVQGGDSEFYVIERRGKPINNTRNVTVPIIVTIQIGEEGVASEALRQRVEEDVRGFGFELQISDEGGITRFNYCPPETTDLPSPDGDPSLNLQINWIDTQIGILANVPCPCNFSLGSTALIATRECGGDFVTRAVWLEPDTTACEFSVTTRKLCRLADISNFVFRLQSLESLVSGDPADLSVTSLLVITAALESLLDNVASNPNLTSVFLDIIQYVLESNVTGEAQRQFNVSARILILIDNLGSKIPVEETEVVTYTRNSFSLAVHINDSRASSPMFGEDNNAGIILPTPLINSITFNTTMSRVVFSYYTTNALFQTVNRRNDSTLVSDVWSVTVPNTRVTDLDENSSVIIRLGNIEVNDHETRCVFWNFVMNDGYGGWDSEGCIREINSNSEVTCVCNHLTHFALITQTPSDESTTSKFSDVITILESVSVACVALTIIFLFIVFFTHLLSWKLRTQVQVKLFLNLCTALIVLYIIYIGALYARNHTTSCIVFSALFHYVFLVVLIALIGDVVYSLATLTTIPSENYHLFVACISWILPALLVGLIVAPLSSFYGNDQFCRPDGLLFYISLLIPFALTVIAIFIMNSVIIIILLKQRLLTKSERTPQLLRSILLTLLFTLGWAFGLAKSFATDTYAILFECLFLLFGALLGIYIFLIYCVMSNMVRIKVWKQWFYKATCRDYEEHDPGNMENDTPINQKKSTDKPNTVLEFTEIHGGPSADFHSPTDFPDRKIKTTQMDMDIEVTKQTRTSDSVSSHNGSSHDSRDLPVA